MPFFIVTMSHPDGDGWDRHVGAHVDYLKTLVAAGSLKASGPLKGTRLRSGFLIFSAASRAEVGRLIAADPFAVGNLIEDLAVTEWDPVFGTFATESSGRLPGSGEAASDAGR